MKEGTTAHYFLSHGSMAHGPCISQGSPEKLNQQDMDAWLDGWMDD